MFYELKNENITLPNLAVNPLVKESDKMVYLALSEYFFDSGLDAYHKAEMFKTEISNGRVSKPNHIFIVVASEQLYVKLKIPQYLQPKMLCGVVPDVKGSGDAFENNLFCDHHDACKCSTSSPLPLLSFLSRSHSP